MNVANFKKEFEPLVNFLDDEGFELHSIKVSGPIDTEIIGIKSNDPDALTNLILPDEVKKNFKLSSSFSKIRPMCTVSSEEKSYLTTFSLGEMYSSLNVLNTSEASFQEQNFVPFDRMTAALYTQKIYQKFFSIKGRAPLIMFNEANAKVTTATLAHTWVHELSYVNDEDFLVEILNIFGLASMPRDVNGRKLRVFMTGSAQSGFQDGTYYAQPSDEWELRSWEPVNLIAPDVRYVAAEVVTMTDRTMYATDDTQYYARTLGFKEATIQLGGKDINRIGLVFEIPYHEGPNDTTFVVGHNFDNRFLVRGSTRFDSTLVDEPLVAAQRMNRPLIDAVYPGAVFSINGVNGPLSAFPDFLKGVKGMGIEWFIPLIGVPPYAHMCMIGDIADDESSLSCDAVHFKADSNWFDEYHLSGFGRKLRPLAASRIKDEWPIDASNVTLSLYTEDMPVTEDDIKSLRLAREYKKHREDACKTDNFMTLDYVDGVSYRKAIEKTKGLVNLCAFDNYGTDSIIEATKSLAVITSDGAKYTVKSDGKTTNYVLATMTAVQREELLTIVGTVYMFGGNVPDNWITDLGVSPLSAAELTDKRFNIMNDKRDKYWIFSRPMNVKANTSAVNTVGAFSKNGFLNLDTMTEEDRIYAKLHSAVCTSATSTSIKSILKQFWNDNYAVPLA